MDNKEANSKLGIASNKLADALYGLKHGTTSKNKLRDTLFEYGKAIIMEAR